MSEAPEKSAALRIGRRYEPKTEHPLLRPKDAASIILIDRTGPHPRILMGRRAKAHVFMPDVFVFPGGRRDPADSRITVARGLQRQVADKLAIRAGAAMSDARARALGVTAIRETMEETGLLIGTSGKVGRHADWATFADKGLAPDLAHLRFIARATTPPRQKRRFDTRFFACFLDEIGVEPGLVSDSVELTDLTWAGFDDVGAMPLPDITRIVLEDLRSELAHDPSLLYGRPVPFYTVERGIFVRHML